MDNKFRLYVKEEEFRPFFETTELDGQDMKAEVNEIKSVVEAVKKNLHSDIHNSVRKATSHLRNQTNDSLGNNVDNMLMQAHMENKTDGLPKVAVSKVDANPTVKQSLLEILNSKASLEDLRASKQDKTNKSDTDM